MNLKNILILLIGLSLFTGAASAADYIIQDSNGNQLFVVNETGEKQIQNGNLFLNGNAITDNDGSLTLEGGNVDIPSGDLDIQSGHLQVPGSSSRDIRFNNNAVWVGRGYQGGSGDLDLAGFDSVNLYGENSDQFILQARDSGNVEIPNGNLQMNNNEIQDVSALELGWANLTDYPTGCETDEAVRVIGDTLDCASLNPGGTVETGGGAKGQVAYFIDSENITGSDNFYWNNSEVELGIGTNTPTAALDVNGQTNLRNTLFMNGNDISNPGNVDGVHLDSPGNAIEIDGSSQYYIPADAIDTDEINSNAITASGGELDSSVAGTQLGYSSGSLDVQDTWVNEGGDTMSGALNLDGNNLNNPNNINFADSNNDGITFDIGEPGGGADNLEIKSSEGVDIFDMRSDGTVYMSGPLNLGSNNINSPNLVDGVDLDNPGNGIIIDGSNRYAIDSNSVGSGELQENSVTNTELANSDSFDMAGLTVTGDAQVQGDLDVWGNISNTDVENLNINGSLLPPSGYSDTFDVGSSTRRWRNGYFQDLILGNNAVDNNELANSQITVNANSGLSGGGSASLGGSTGLSHADTSTQSNIDNSGGTIIQDLDFDTYGHVTGQNSYNLDNRYYTESESDSNFVDESGDTMGGSLTISNADDGKMNLEAADVGSTGGTAEGGWNYIEFFDAQSDRQGYFGIDSSGNFQFSPEVSGSQVEVESSLSVSGDFNMNSNSINNFFGSNCGSGEVVKRVNSGGSYNCVSITDETDNKYVDEAGDTMTGALNMTGDDIQNVGTINASTIQENGNDIGGLYVDESGDSMSGSLNMQGNHIDNANFIDLNSVGDIRVDGTDAVRLDSNQNVEVPNGNLDVGGSSVGSQTLNVNGDILTNGEIRFTNGAVRVQRGNYIDDTGSADLRLRGFHGVQLYAQDTTTKLLNAKNNGNVEIPNGNLKLSTNAARWASVGDNNGYRIKPSAADNPDLVFTDTGGTNVETLRLKDGGNVKIPNGNLDLSGQLSVGSTECSTGSYIDGDGTCTSVASETSDLYVDEAGDTMSGDLNMNYNDIGNVSTLNVSTSSDQIAHFSDTGVEISQPLSVESSGPLSVANGIDLTDGSSNTIESYSTMYLSTSSGSPSDIVLEPTGDVGLDANTSITGDLNMQDGAITDIDWANSDDGSGSSLDADLIDGVQLSNINWGDVAMAQNDISVSNLGAADANLDMNENQIQNVNALQDGTGTNTINFDGSNNVQIPNGNLDVSSPSSTDHTMDIGGSLGVEGNLDINSNSLNNVDQIDFDEDSKDKAQWYNQDYTTGVESSTLYWESNNRFRWYANNVGEDGGSSDHMQLDSNQLDLSRVDLDMNNNVITGVSSPSDSDDAVPKSYVDNAADGATQTLSEVLSQGNDATSTPIVNVGSNNIDIGDGEGNIAMNGQRIVDGGLVQVSGMGITDSLSTAENEVSGNSLYVQQDVSVDGDFVGAGADVAENINNESEMSSGTVVKISGNMSVDKTQSRRDTSVAGVVSRDPAMIMAKERDGVPIAMSGTVPVKFSDENGAVKPGDFLTTASKEGHAMKCANIVECQGAIIGKAMQPQTETGEVQMMISRG